MALVAIESVQRIEKLSSGRCIYRASECVRRRRDNHVRITLVAPNKTLKAKAVQAKTIQLDSGAGVTQGTFFPGFPLGPDADPEPAVGAVEVMGLAVGVPAVPGKPRGDLSGLGVANGSPLLAEWNDSAAPLMLSMSSSFIPASRSAGRAVTSDEGGCRAFESPFHPWDLDA